MPNETEDYNNFVRANLPAGMSYSANRYRYNNHSFYVFELAAWYYYYLLRVNSPSNLFSANEQGVWYDPSDLTTLFQDSAGTTPVTAVGQPVGLMLDKSKGLALGAELVSNGDFSNGTTGWSPQFGSSISVIGGELQMTAGAAGTQRFSQPITCVIGKTYRVTVTARQGTTPTTILIAASASANLSSAVATSAAITSTANTTVSFYFVATATTMYVGGNDTAATIGVTSFFDNISVRELAGNHATQATAAQRPTYGIHPYSGVRNVANGSAAFSNATYWPATSTQNSITATRTAGSDAQGSYVDVRFVSALTTGTAQAGFYVEGFSRASATSGETFTASVIVERIAVVGSTAGIKGILTGVVWETAPDTFIGLQLSGYANSDTPTTITATRAIPSGNQARTFLSLDVAIGSTIDVTYRIRAFQFEKSATRTAYQANYTQYNITEAGVPSVHYVGFDGVDDGMVTSAITPATDKAQIFSGFRKSALNNGATLVELSASSDTNNGSVAFFADAIGGAGIYQARTRGTVLVATNYNTAPVGTAVIAFLTNLAAPSQIIRVNGSQVVSNTSNTGSGNFLAYPLYIGRRGGSEIPFNGNLYSLIVRFGSNLTTGQITSTETWVNGKTGAY